MSELNRVRSVVDVATLALHTVHIESIDPPVGKPTTEPVAMGLSTGHRFNVEMRGKLYPFDAELRPGLRVSLWATLARVRRGSNPVSQVTFEQLLIGVVTDADMPDDAPLDPELGNVFDITHSVVRPNHPHPGEQRIPGFPTEWRHHVAAHVTAAVLNYYIDVYER